jgi:hypothetical protein
VIVHDVPQRTPEWYALRCARLTGSHVADMLATLKSKGEAAARRDLRTRLVVERLTGRSLDEGGYRSTEMQWGIDHEDDARRAYEAKSGHVVRVVGFVAHDELPTGCSPDGLIGTVGSIEIKCPKPATHLDAIRARAIPADYLPQVRHTLWMTGAAWCDFISFDPRFPRPLQLVIVRATMSEHERAAWAITVRGVLAEVDRECAELQQLVRAA